MKKLLFILFSLITMTSCELDNFNLIHYVHTKFYVHNQNNNVNCELYHNSELEHIFVLNESNGYTTVKKLICDEEYTLVTQIDTTLYSRTFKASCENSMIRVNIVVDPTVDEIEDEIIFGF